MRPRWLSLSLCGVRLAPNDGWPLLAVAFAVAAWLIALGAAGLLAAADIRRGWEALGRQMTVEVPADVSEARLDTVVAALRQTRGVASASVLQPADLSRLLQPWLGPDVNLDELPVPKLVDLRLAPGSEPDIAALRKQLGSIAPQARLDDGQSLRKELRVALRRIAGVLAAATVLGLAAAGVLAVFAGRSAAAANRDLVEAAHLLGAFDRDIALPLAARALQSGALGGAVGVALAMLALAVLGHAGAVIRVPAPAAAAGLADWRPWALAVGALLAVAAVAAAGAYATVRRRLAAMP